MELFRLSARALNRLFLDRKLSAEEIALYFLKRARSCDRQIQAFLEILEERALKQARLLDHQQAAGEPLGPLAGVPVAIKNNMHIQGVKTTCGSKILKNYRAPFSATAVERLEKAGALLIGTTNLDEFAMGSSTENSAFFPTLNPWDPGLVPGGSSGGSAAAVASRSVLLALGSDTGGSIRQPAAFCGIVGFKPTYGRVSRSGLVAFASSFDQIGPLAASCEDIALALETIHGQDPKDATTLDLCKETFLGHDLASLQGLTIGVPKFADLKPETQSNFNQNLTVLQKLGATTIELDLDILKYAIAVYYILAPAEASTNLARFDGIRFGYRSPQATNLDQVYELSREEGFGAEVKRRILIGTYVLSASCQEAFYKKAQKVRTLTIRAFEKAFETCDLIATPTTPSSAFAIGGKPSDDPLQMYLEDLFTVPVNIAGLPALSLPSGFDRQNRPFGLQLIGPQLHDQKVLQAGRVFEKAASANFKIPPL
ncbi:MAG: Asp-tRNA(Asn)/Glu-tRNA(Gln) amidotransferase subunit GatA, partial [Parachlamydiales bacterium]